jgi:hypothetical protein
MEGETTTKSQWICNKENGNLGIGNCSSHGTHNLGVASYVPHHDNYATSINNSTTSPMDTQQIGGWYYGNSNWQHGKNQIHCDQRHSLWCY